MTEMDDKLKDKFLLKTKLPVYKKRVAFSKQLIEKELNKKTFYVSFSGGKDSLALLHLFNSVASVVAVHIDSGAEPPEAIACISIMRGYGYNIRTYRPAMTIVEMCRDAAFWGASPIEKEVTWDINDWKEILLYEPSRRAANELDVDGICLGLRKKESRGRMMMLNRYGLLHKRSDGALLFNPIANWDSDDVIGYCYEHNLPLSASYTSKKTVLDARNARTGTLLGTSSLTHGRFQELRRSNPEAWARIIAEFPRLDRYA